MPTHAESRVVPFTPEQMWDLVADVDRYPQFLPWCVGAKVRAQTDSEQIADMAIGFGPFRERFTSRNALLRPRYIKVRYESGPFRYLNNDWNFSTDPRGCKVDFRIDFEFRNRMLQVAIGVVFSEATRRMVNAFLRRARDVYGAPATPPPAPAPAPAAGDCAGSD
jgi:coenzyme Q-binding protein COQ10